MAKPKKEEKPDELLSAIEGIITKLLKLDTMPHAEQMQLLDRALKLAEIKKKGNESAAFGSAFNDD